MVGRALVRRAGAPRATNGLPRGTVQLQLLDALDLLDDFRELALDGLGGHGVAREHLEATDLGPQRRDLQAATLQLQLGRPELLVERRQLTLGPVLEPRDLGQRVLELV